MYTSRVFGECKYADVRFLVFAAERTAVIDVNDEQRHTLADLQAFLDGTERNRSSSA
jgi:hypothetical protein